MPPQRIRNGFDDSRSEASSTRDKQPAYTGISKGRRNGTSTLAGSNLKDVTNAQATTSGQQGDAAVSVKICPGGERSSQYINYDSIRSTGPLSTTLCYMLIATCTGKLSLLSNPFLIRIIFGVAKLVFRTSGTCLTTLISSH